MWTKGEGAGRTDSDESDLGTSLGIINSMKVQCFPSEAAPGCTGLGFIRGLWVRACIACIEFEPTYCRPCYNGLRSHGEL